MDDIKLLVNAKINLSLDITGVRQDGYHILDMTMTSVDIFDELRARKSDASQAFMDGKIAGDGNTASKALKLLQDAYGVRMSVDIAKGIPFSAGMGGSSADASGVFVCASELFGIPLAELMPLALKVGCDAPYMCYGGGARVRGVGEIVQPMDIPSMTLVVAQKTAGASTRDIYRKYDEIGGDREGEHFNVLERAATALVPEIAVARRDLQKYTDKVFMTGSGSAYVGVFDCEDRAKKCLSNLNGYAFARVARTQSKGIKIS